jgi:hypothetical protein
MALPKAVQEQLDEADRLAAELDIDQTNNLETNLDPSDPNNPAPEPQPQEPVSHEPTPEPVPDSKWEAKYHTLKGMYDAEVPRLHSQVRELNSQVQTLIAEVAQAKVQTPSPQETAKSLITEQDKEAFGPDLIDLIERAAESKVSTLRGRESDLMKELNELKSQLGDVSERQVVSDKDRFINGLAKKVPDWESLNTDQGFLTWLQQEDPVYGLPRQIALNNAYEQFQVDRVASIFNAYKATTTPAPSTRPKINPELQRQVAPARSRSAAPPADSQDQKIYTQSEIGQFFDDWRRGLFTDEEAASFEKAIHAAVTEGRVR